MKVFVYGTLKRGYHNNVLLSNAKFLEEKVLPGFKLYNAGFPVARESPGDSVFGEVFEIADNDKNTLRNLDRLEGEGRMYHRQQVEGENVSLYVGYADFWDFQRMPICPKREDGSYIWDR